MSTPAFAKQSLDFKDRYNSDGLSSDQDASGEYGGPDDDFASYEYEPNFKVPHFTYLNVPVLSDVEVKHKIRDHLA